MGEEQKRISANLPEGIYDALMGEAQRQERSVGVVIKRAIVQYLEMMGSAAVTPDMKFWEEPELPLEPMTGGDDE